jgi:hypothetical protein
MTFASFQHDPVRDAIKHLASANKLAVFVGAGAAVEAGMPQWPQLVHRLLLEASNHAGFRDDEQRQAWAEKTMLSELPPGAAGIAQTLLRERLGRALYNELYRPPDGSHPLKPTEFVPGPTANAVAALRITCDQERSEHGKMKILTTNYDDLLERALRARDDVASRQVLSLFWPHETRNEPPHAIKVFHLHGVLTSRTPRGNLTLTDTSFYRPSPSSPARDRFVTGILSDYRCLFLGTSFTDPNLMRFIYSAAQDRVAGLEEDEAFSAELRHIALFTHHSGDPPELRRVREEITRDRLSDAFVEPVFLDHFGDVSQFVYELRKRIEEEGMPHYDTRCRRVIGRILKNALYCARPERFAEAQDRQSRWLARTLKQTTDEVDKRCGSNLSAEKLTLSVWLLSEDGSEMTPWVMSDRLHRDPELIPPEPVDVHSRWLAVRAVCGGTWIQTGDPQQRSSWSYIAAFPLLVADGNRKGRLCVGALSLTTMTPKGETWLHKRGPHQRELNNRLNGAVADWLISLAENP